MFWNMEANPNMAFLLFREVTLKLVCPASRLFEAPARADQLPSTF